jgi:DNA-nicking Smr family endonuclease
MNQLSAKIAYMTKRKISDMTEDDRAAFREAMRGVKPLVHDKTSLQKPEPTKYRPHKHRPDEKTPGFEFSDHENLPSVSGDDRLEFTRSGVQYKMLRKLRLGQYNIEAILDLHGKTVAEARESLSGFLVHCQQRNLRHVLIIHGKGQYSNQPILKNKLNHWLRQTEQILAFCSASPKSGSSGAVFVLLRREDR